MVHKDMVTAVLQPVESVGRERNQTSRVCQASESSSDPNELPECMVPLFERSSEHLDTAQRTR